MRCLILALLSMVSVEAAANKLAGVPAEMQKWVDWQEIAGAVTLVAQDGKILELDAVGYANLAARRPMKTDSVFWVASMTKPVTSAAILLLSDEGKLGIDDPIGKYLPAFKELPKITIRHLLTHMHGLPEPEGLDENATLEEVAGVMARQQPAFEPGTQWRYGNGGMSLLGRIIEVVSGQSYPDFLQDRFFTPLGMTDTTFYPGAERLSRLATSYRMPPEGGPLVEAKITIIPGDLASTKRTPGPGSGLFSTATDMFRFYQMLLNGGELDGRRYLKPESVREMFTVQTGELEAGFCAGMGWGLGIGVIRRPEGWTRGLAVGTVNHDGAYGTTVMLEPGRKLLFIMMIQAAGLNPFRDGLRFRQAFTDAVMQAMTD